jgi:hypothetical protein
MGGNQSTVEELSSLLLTEFPIDVLRLIMNDLSAEDVAHLCASNKEFGEKCQKYDLVNWKVRKFLDEKSPLALPNYNIFDQYNLLKRGMKTVYHLDPGMSMRKNLPEFGAAEYGTEVQFELPGMPPPKGTKLLILFQKRRYPEDNFRDVFASVYGTLNDVYMILNNNELWERDPNLQLFVNIRADIMQDEDQETGRADLEDLAVKESIVILRDMLESGTNNPDFEFYEIELP